MDQNATEIAAYLVPNGYSPPLMSGGATLPADLEQNAVTRVMVDRYRTLQFSGYTWNVKASETPVGPGSNYFSAREEDVWVDGSGRLHLRIAQHDGRWYASEVFTRDTLGYGVYTFTLSSRVDQLDKNVVLGLFTWDEAAPAYNYREIDIEFSRWGEAAGDNTQYVVQPWDHPGNRHRFDLVLAGDDSTHGFAWSADSVRFASLAGHPPGAPLETWQYTGPDIPPDGAAQARINLWLYQSSSPSDGQAAEVIVEGFQFVRQVE
jgi:hypothetical protein